MLWMKSLFNIAVAEEKTKRLQNHERNFEIKEKYFQN